MVHTKRSTLVLTDQAVEILDGHIEKMLRDPDALVRVQCHNRMCREAFPGYSPRKIGILLGRYVSLRRDRWAWTPIIGRHCGYTVTVMADTSAVNSLGDVGVEA